MFDLKEHTMLLTVAGSRAYGTHTPTSDVDIKGVCIPPREYFTSPFKNFEQADSPSHLEVFRENLSPELQQVARETKMEGTVYGLFKFAKLATDCNPNILDVLFCRDEEVLFGQHRALRLERGLFLSKKVKHTFSGYAMAQLKRIRHHRSWLLSPPKGKPVRADFGLPEHTLIPADQLAAVQAAVQKKLDEWTPNLASVPVSDRVAIQEGIQTFLEEFISGLPEGLVSEDDRVEGARWLAAARTVGIDDNLMLVLQREREWGAAQRGWSQYQTWLRQRNPERAALEAAAGYDTKHAMHLVRLMRMGQEALETGRINVWRGDIDAEELVAIRHGAWSYDNLVEWAEGADKALNETYRTSKALPERPDLSRIEWLVECLVEDVLSKRH